MKSKNQMENDSNENHWKTPSYVYDPLNAEFNFDFDPCPLRHDITMWNGLEIEWKNSNFINPPYDRKLKELFVKKAVEESKKGKLCVLLLPVSTSTELFHETILPNFTDLRFVRRRIKFEGYNLKGEFVKSKVGINDSMIIVFDGRKENE